MKDRLQRYPETTIKLLEISTQGDEHLDVSLTKVGGKGVFVKELETALYDGRADLAVHSLKDVPMELPVGLDLCCLTARETPTDALVHRIGTKAWLIFLTSHTAHLGTRACDGLPRSGIASRLKLSPVRGNLGTRLEKLDSGEFDGLVLASAGPASWVTGRIAFETKPEEILPACGQGILGIEIREDDRATRDMVMILRDGHGEITGRAERALNRHLNGGCQVPIAAYAMERGETYGCAPGGLTRLWNTPRAEDVGTSEEAEALGVRVAEN